MQTSSSSRGKGFCAATLFAALALSPASATSLDPVSCLIQPEDTVRLATPVAGIVAEVAFDRGDTVAAGDVIARLDATLETIALSMAEARAESDARTRAAEARLAFMNTKASRAEDLALRNAISQTEATQARLDADIARHDLDEALLAGRLALIDAEQARAVLDQKVLRTPIDGVVVERLLTAGEFRDPQSHIATIARLDILRVEAFAPLHYYSHLAVGQQVAIHPEAPFEGIHMAEITVIDQVFDAATATFGLRMTLPNPDLVLPAGLRCEVHFAP